MSWKKYISREFLIAIGLIVTATVAMFQVLTAENFSTVFTIWSGACGGFVALYTGGKTIQKVKGTQ